MMQKSFRNGFSVLFNLKTKLAGILLIQHLYYLFTIVPVSLAGTIDVPETFTQNTLYHCPTNPIISIEGRSVGNTEEANCSVGFQTLLIENNSQEVSEISVCGNVTLTCRSEEPVGWQYNGPESSTLEKAIISVNPARKTSGTWSVDETASCFEVTLTLNKNIFFQGRYTCFLLEKPFNQSSSLILPLRWNSSNASSVYLYGWLANPKPAPVKSLEFRKYNEVVIPCLSKNSKLPAELLRVNTTHVSKLDDKYDSRFGFHIRGSSADDIAGTYQCKSDQSVSWNVTVSPFISVSVLSENISIGYDDKKDCYTCTNGDMESLTILPCDNPFHCDLLLEANKDPLSTQVTSSKQQSNKTCTPGSSDLVICRDGNNYQYSLFVQPVKGNVTTLDKATFADLNFTNKGFEDREFKLLYVSDTFDIICNASQNLFSNGLKLLVEYKNGSKYADDIILRTTHNASEGYYHTKWKINITSTDIHGIYCSAPYIGTKGWRVEKLQDFYGVKDPIPVEIIEASPSQVTFAQNAKDVSITCVAESAPVSAIKWSKDGKEFSELNETIRQIFYPSVEENDTIVRSKIVFKVVKGPGVDASGTWVCRGSNGHSEVNYTIKVNVEDSKSLLPGDNPGIGYEWIFIPAALICTVALIAAVVLLKLKKDANFLDHQPLLEEDKITIEDITPTLLKEDYWSTIQNTKWELRIEDIELGEELAAGHFGKVHAGILKSVSGIKPAVFKLPRMTESGIKALMDELRILYYIRSFVDHKHVVEFIGAITTYDASTREGTLLAVLEKCDFSLAEFFEKNKQPFIINYEKEHPRLYSKFIPGYVQFAPTTPPKFKTSDLYRWSFEIASALHCLVSKGLIHRDVAIRNILLQNQDGVLVAKVTDFGLSRLPDGKYYVQMDHLGGIPVRQTAPEIFRNWVYSEATDVYSFGTMLWEMFTLGDMPYESYANEAVVSKVLTETDVPHSQPKYADTKIWNVMRLCWSRDPKKRPKFSQLARQLMEFLSKEDQAKVDDGIYPKSRDFYNLTASPNPEGQTDMENEQTTPV